MSLTSSQSYVRLTCFLPQHLRSILYTTPGLTSVPWFRICLLRVTPLCLCFPIPLSHHLLLFRTPVKSNRSTCYHGEWFCLLFPLPWSLVTSNSRNLYKWNRHLTGSLWLVINSLVYPHLESLFLHLTSVGSSGTWHFSIPVPVFRLLVVVSLPPVATYLLGLFFWLFTGFSSSFRSEKDLFLRLSNFMLSFLFTILLILLRLNR